MSGRTARESRREERVRAESATGSEERRKRLLQLASAAVFLAIAAVAVLIVVSQSQTDGGDTSLEDIAEVKAELRGIPQRGLVLGDPDARVELIEYGDLQCPVCKVFAEEVLSPVIENQVRAGAVKVSFRNFPIIGEQSWPAGTAALAAGSQGRGWNFVELFYRNQGIEDSGYADDEFLTAIAKAAGVEDLSKWNRERNSERLADEVQRTGMQAEDLGVTGTPTIAVKGPNVDGTEVLGAPSSPGELEDLVENAG